MVPKAESLHLPLPPACDEEVVEDVKQRCAWRNACHIQFGISWALPRLRSDSTCCINLVRWLARLAEACGEGALFESLPLPNAHKWRPNGDAASALWARAALRWACGHVVWLLLTAAGFWRAPRGQDLGGHHRA